MHEAIIEASVKFMDRNHLLMEMAPKYNSEKLGLSFKVYVSTNEGVSHGPRVKISKLPHNGNFDSHTESVPVTIHPTDPDVPGDITYDTVPKKRLKDIKKWIKINHKALMDFWERRISEDVFLHELKNLNGKYVIPRSNKEVDSTGKHHISIQVDHDDSDW